MGYTLIKPDKEEDFYVLWCGYTDRPIGTGTRQDWMEYEPENYSEDRMERTDRNGSSSMIRSGWWDKDRFIIHNVTKKLRTVARTDLSAFTQEYLAAFPSDWSEFTPPKAARAVLKKYGTVFDYED